MRVWISVDVDKRGVWMREVMDVRVDEHGVGLVV